MYKHTCLVLAEGQETLGKVIAQDNLPIAPAKLTASRGLSAYHIIRRYFFGDASPSLLSTQPWLRRSSILPPVFPYCSTRVLIPVSIGIGTTMTSLVTLVFRHPHMRTYRFTF